MARTTVLSRVLLLGAASTKWFSTRIFFPGRFQPHAMGLMTFKSRRRPFVTLNVANCGRRIFKLLLGLNVYRRYFYEPYPVSEIPPLLPKAMERAPFRIFAADDCDIATMDVEPRRGVCLIRK
jgi:hypothetical protein